MDQPLKARVVKRFFKITFTEVTGWSYLVQADSEEEAKQKWQDEDDKGREIWSGVEDVSITEVNSDGKARNDSRNDLQ